MEKEDWFPLDDDEEDHDPRVFVNDNEKDEEWLPLHDKDEDHVARVTVEDEVRRSDEVYDDDDDTGEDDAVTVTDDDVDEISELAARFGLQCDSGAYPNKVIDGGSCPLNNSNSETTKELSKVSKRRVNRLPSSNLSDPARAFGED